MLAVVTPDLWGLLAENRGLDGIHPLRRRVFPVARAPTDVPDRAKDHGKDQEHPSSCCRAILSKNTSHYREKLCNISNSGADVRCVIAHIARFPFLIFLRSPRVIRGTVFASREPPRGGLARKLVSGDGGGCIQTESAWHASSAAAGPGCLATMAIAYFDASDCFNRRLPVRQLAEGRRRGSPP